ncbi:response regulator [Geminocystis sp.]|uniref:response regulator n=1 Tax=Geminocystis sp. TaxID=2664100 RepID=UPI0035939BC8
MMITTMVKNEVTKSKKETVAIPYQVLQSLLNKKISGKLIIQNPQDESIEWVIYLGKGKIHFATTTLGKRERLIYLLSQCFSEHNFYIPQELHDDYQFIHNQWENHRLDSRKVRSILAFMTQEAIIRCLTLPRAKVNFEKVLDLDPLILNTDIKSLINPLKKDLNSFRQIREEISSPFIRLQEKDWESVKNYLGDDLSKIELLESLKPYINDSCTLYEIAAYSKKSILELGLFFQPLIALNFFNVKPYQEIIIEEKPVIACIDDSHTIQRIVKMTLNTGGFEVIGITDPAKAMSMFVRQKPDLILMDINMPDIDGYKLAYMMRQSALLKDIPILMLTGRDGVMDRVKAKMVGAVGYICKPFNPRELMQCVQDHVQITN